MTEEKKVEKAEKFQPEAIRKVDMYVDDKGRRVTEFTQMFGDRRSPRIYKGEAMIVVATNDPRIPPQQIGFEFAFTEGMVLKECFEKFDELAERAKGKVLEEHRKRIDEAKAEQAKQVVPARGFIPKLFGPGGKKL